MYIYIHLCKDSMWSFPIIRGKVVAFAVYWGPPFMETATYYHVETIHSRPLGRSERLGLRLLSRDFFLQSPKWVAFFGG